MQKSYYNYWNKIFNLSTEELAAHNVSITNEGRLVDKYRDQYIYFYQDLTTNKKILAASRKNLESLSLAADDISEIDSTSVREFKKFNSLNLVFHDIDFGLEFHKFQPTQANQNLIKPLNSISKELIEKFFLLCTEDDKDTLDYDIEKDTAFAIYIENEIAGISRFIRIRDTEIADITVLVLPKYRGKGLATPLVSRTIEEIFKHNMHPKYRVKDTNEPSIKVAKKLGFTDLFHLLTWEVT